MGQFILNGRNYSGLIDAQGVFIDTDNVITTYSSSSGASIPNYTATQDSAVSFYVFGKASQTCRIYLNSVEIQTLYFQQESSEALILYLKKGQTISFSSFDYWSFHYEVYGIQMGSPVTFLSEYASACYDTTEREVGCWVDGKPLYQKTIYIPSVTSGTSYNHNIANVEQIFIKDIKSNRNTGWFSSGHIFEDATNNIAESFSIIPSATALFAYVYGCTISECYVTVQYTKTTDVAGSGKLTPTAMPTVHYDDTEKVIGTWFGQTLYQKTVNIGALPNTASKVVAHGISGIDTVVRVYGYATNGSSTMPLPYSTNYATANVGINTPNKTEINIFDGSDRSAFSGYVTLEYTKSS